MTTNGALNSVPITGNRRIVSMIIGKKFLMKIKQNKKFELNEKKIAVALKTAIVAKTNCHLQMGWKTLSKSQSLFSIKAKTRA
jgi:hypothetical protein